MLDTSYCIEILRGKPLPDAWRSYQFCISTIVEAELWAGVYHSGGPKERLKVEKLLSAVERRAFESSASEAAGKVLGGLATLGKSIGDFDALIAGHAIALNMPLATKNKRHFQRIKDLKLLD